MPLMMYCTAALTAFSDSVSYITFLFLEWCIDPGDLEEFKTFINVMEGCT